MSVSDPNREQLVRVARALGNFRSEGLSAIDGDGDGEGQISVLTGQICDNGAPNEGETITLDMVDTTCTP